MFIIYKNMIILSNEKKNPYRFLKLFIFPKNEKD